jgi:DNA modification methylase
MHIPQPLATVLPKRKKSKRSNSAAPIAKGVEPKEREVPNFVAADHKILARLLTGDFNIEEVNVSDITCDDIVKIRDKYDDEKINELVAKLRDGDKLPHIILVRGADGKLKVVDGYYRLLAHLRFRCVSIKAAVIEGEYNDLLRLRLLSNADHPTALTRPEKRRNVRLALLNDFWWKFSDNIMASYCGVSSRLVATVRVEILNDSTVASAKLSQITTRLCIRNGRMYEIKVAGINANRTADKNTDKDIEEAEEKSKNTHTKKDFHNAQIINNRIMVQPGEVFLLFSDDMPFPHIIYNGDGRCEKFRDTVFAFKKAGLLIIDFPYNVDYTGRHSNNKNLHELDKIPNDNLSPDQYQELIDTFLRHIKPIMEPGSGYYVWSGRKYYGLVETLCSNILGESRNDIIWVKRGLRQSTSKFKRGHERAIFGWTEKHLRYWTGGNSLIDVFDDNLLDRSTRKLPRDTHPSPKSDAVYRRMIEVCLEKGEIVFDPMLGSGTTIYAAHLVGCVGVGVELLPEFTAVAVDGMLKLGLKCIRTTLDELLQELAHFKPGSKGIAEESK